MVIPECGHCGSDHVRVSLRTQHALCFRCDMCGWSESVAKPEALDDTLEVVIVEAQ